MKQIELQRQLQNVEVVNTNLYKWRDLIDVSEFPEKELPKEFIKHSSELYPSGTLPFRHTERGLLEYELDKIEKNGVGQELLAGLSKSIPEISYTGKIKLKSNQKSSSNLENENEPILSISIFSEIGEPLDMKIIHELAHMNYDSYLKRMKIDPFRSKNSDAIYNANKKFQLEEYYESNKDNPNIVSTIEDAKQKVTAVWKKYSYETEEFRSKHFSEIYKGQLKKDVLSLIAPHTLDSDKHLLKELEKDDITYKEFFQTLKKIEGGLESKNNDLENAVERDLSYYSDFVIAGNMIIREIQNTKDGKYLQDKINQEKEKIFLDLSDKLYEIDPQFHKAYYVKRNFDLDLYSLKARIMDSISESNAVDVETLYLKSKGHDAIRTSYATHANNSLHGPSNVGDGKHYIIYSDNFSKYFRRSTHAEMQYEGGKKAVFRKQMSQYWDEVYNQNSSGESRDEILNISRELIDEIAKDGIVTHEEKKQLFELKESLRKKYKINLEIDEKVNSISIEGFYRREDIAFETDPNKIIMGGKAGDFIQKLKEYNLDGISEVESKELIDIAKDLNKGENIDGFKALQATSEILGANGISKADIDFLKKLGESLSKANVEVKTSKNNREQDNGVEIIISSPSGKKQKKMEFGIE
ncbi:MAG: hypothetical protein SFT90_04290 [Rickettsiales bacterium]|nr:hypothetical protein [Rickettsiales bacterium]